MRTDARALGSVLAVAVGFGILLWALPFENERAAVSVCVLWCSALFAVELLATSKPGFAGPWAIWALAGPVAMLAEDSALFPFSVLIATTFLLGAARLLGAPMCVPEIMVTELDVERLSHLLEALPARSHGSALAIERELARAQVVASTAIPRDVVTMNSRVVFEHETTGKRLEAVLVYPQNSEAGEGTISILAPVGTALLGLREGQCIDWRMPTGRCERIRVINVAYQPEAAGDFHL